MAFIWQYSLLGVTSLAPGQLIEYPNATEMALNDMGKMNGTQPQQYTA